MKSPYSQSRRHVGESKIGETLQCEIIKITQRRNFNGGMKYYDSSYKLKDSEGNTWWTSGGLNKHIYVKLGTVTLVDDMDEAIWFNLSDENKIAYLKSDSALIDFMVGRHNE